MQPIFAQEQFYFYDEFNEQRPPNILNPDKWIVYPNKRTTPTTTGCMFDTVTENDGLLHLKQCERTPQFPYITTKNNPIPKGNYTAIIRFKYVGISGQGNGIQFVDMAPDNGAGYTNLFGFGTWETGTNGATTQAKLQLIFEDDQVVSINADTNYHEFKVQKVNDIYKLYLDNQLYFTSQPTDKKVEAVYFGDPAIQNPLLNWNQFWIDYIRISYDGPSQAAVEPFLDLPWNYEIKGMSFSEAATSIGSYFDHEYPFLSTNLSEPFELIPYFKNEKTTKPYSSHDGYDYGSLAQTKLGTPQLAAAGGEATYLGSCGACGNAILVDHKNGFQTRYYHLQSDELIIKQEGIKIPVTKGQKIGRVGYSGNVIPPNKPEGAHIHFMVIQDKNNDGNFEDNIPDGLVDPFGWQSTDPDPWENYSFFYKGQQRTGNKSHYLFTKKLDNLDETLTSNQAVFNIGKTTLTFPEGSTNENVSIKTTAQPTYIGPLLNSLGSVINIVAKNSAEQDITTFLKNFTLKIDFSQFDLTRYDLNTLSIYSSQDGENWTKEDTQINTNEKSASTSINHLTYFALMAERVDTIAPTTTPVLLGDEGRGNNFKSNITLSLNSVDNSGGLGVEYTAWGFEDQPWQPYSTPIFFTEERSYKIYFYSEDKDGNIEEIKSVEFSIDKTPPEAKIEVDKINWDLKVLPLASDSSILKTPLPKNKAIYKLTDPAGNTLTLDTYHLNTKSIDILKIYSLQYNNEPKIPLPDNLLDTNYIFYTPKTREEIKLINQNFYLKNQVTYVIIADAIRQKTILNILEQGTKRKEELPGLKLLNLKTNQSKLEYSY